MSTKALKVISSAALAATFVVPVAAPAFAAATYNTTAVKSVVAGQNQELGSIYVEFNPAELTTSSYMTVRLPSDFDFGAIPSTLTTVNNFSSSSGFSTGNIELVAPQFDNAFVSSSDADIFQIQKISGNEFKLQVNPTANLASAFDDTKNKAYFYIKLKNVGIPSGFDGEVKAVIESDTTPFKNGEVTVGVVGTGSVVSSIDKAETITSIGGTIEPIRIKEDRAGAFATNDTITYKLPAGFSWNTGVTTTSNIGIVSGELVQGDFGISVGGTDNRELTLTVNKRTTNNPAYITLKGLQVQVTDETVAKKGDVEVSIKGKASSKTSSLVVAKYGDFGAKVYAVGDTPSVVAGKKNEKIGMFAIEETVPKSLVPDRTITLTLTGGAKWATTQDEFNFDAAQSKNATNSFIQVNSATVQGAGSDVLKITTGAAGSQPSEAIKAVLKKAKINVAPNAEGDIKVIVGGTAGAAGEIVVAKAVKPVSTTIDGQLPNITIGQPGTVIPDITVSENQAGAIADGARLGITFPIGVYPSLPSKVEVTEGDLVLQGGTVGRSYNDGRWTVFVDTKLDSSKASKVKFSGIKVDTDRTVPEGDLTVEVGGSALVETDATNIFPGLQFVDKVNVAKVVTPAAGKGGVGTAVFKLNSKSFTVDGKTVEMDVQPLVKWDRAYVPVRFAANALGVADDNIVWDDKTQTVTIFHNGKVVQMTVGKKEYTVNGVKVAMDVPVFRNKVETNNRTLLPIRYVAQALGVPVNWNQETGEIVLGEQK